MSILKHKYYEVSSDSKIYFTLYNDGTIDTNILLDTFNVTNYIDVINNNISLLLVIQISTGTVYLYPVGYKTTTKNTEYTSNDMRILTYYYNQVKIVTSNTQYSILMGEKIMTIGDFTNQIAFSSDNEKKLYERIFSNKHAFCAIEKGTTNIVTWGHPKYGGIYNTPYTFYKILDIHSTDTSFTAVVKQNESDNVFQYITWGIHTSDIE